MSISVFAQEPSDSTRLFLTEILACLCRLPRPPCIRKRHCRHGKRGGCLVKSKICLWGIERCFLSGSDQQGVNPDNLQRITTRSAGTGASPPPALPTRFALINTRSVGNKTFILKEFFLYNSLNVLCAAKSWISPGESSTLAEVLPPGCFYINTPRPYCQNASEVKFWLSHNSLWLNDSKTDAILFSPTNTNAASGLPTLPSLNLKSCATSLGVKLDSDLSMTSQVNATVRSCFFKLRRITRLKSILKRQHLESVIHAFITSRLDYANSVLIGINVSTLSRLQKVQNAAARFLTNTDRRIHITPILTDLHWLPVKILLFVYKALNCPSPSYLAELLSPYVPTRPLRSADHLLLVVPKVRYKSRGERAFSHAAPKLWNTLPIHVRLAPSVSRFKSALKTHFFSIAFPP
uniref:Reverse transcriptase domain-containing protein n=1 Tax=Iconisemion striatum TaxID=60296 RepID=A0A1A7Z355_9TELE